jgi:hypothetical protein
MKEMVQWVIQAWRNVLSGEKVGQAGYIEATRNVLSEKEVDQARYTNMK